MLPSCSQFTGVASQTTRYTERVPNRGSTELSTHAKSQARTNGRAAPHTPLWSRPGYLVRRVHQNHTALFTEECKAYGITPVQYGVLTALLHRPGIDQATLGAEVGIDRTNAADVLERLAERGLVRREKSGADRRMMLADLTAEGRSLTREMQGAMQRAQERLLEVLNPAERKSFMRQLLKLVDALGAPPAEPARPHAVEGDAGARRARRQATR
ncbi:MAG: winged helix-turn-helix transcriptional regulator [Proteobacteria bacterium]|nr:winged helix-turn-helix transcriptional regulator [Pseudomonadota bacterium]